jgi:hypothetical protein
MSNQAKDFIIKLCHISQVERYDSKRALQHPFITRNLDDVAPLTQSEEIKLNNTQQGFAKCIKILAFLQMVQGVQKVDASYMDLVRS